MGVYERYASGTHDHAFFTSGSLPASDVPTANANTAATTSSTDYSPSTNLVYLKINDAISFKDDVPVGYIQLNPLSGQFDPHVTDSFNVSTNSMAEWLDIFPGAAYFIGHDDALFESMLVIVYENFKTNKISTLSISKFGVVCHENLILDSRLRFWGACENLSLEHRSSNVRKALAITLLKNCNRLANQPGKFVVPKLWDETHAGPLASSMTLLVDRAPEELGCKLLELGLLQKHTIQSAILDVVYDNSSVDNDARVMEENNRLVFLLGAQLDQLFDPLLEYSPEHMHVNYLPPSNADFRTPHIYQNPLVESIVGEILTVQTQFTMGLVNLLQNFIIPLRVYVLASTPGLGIAKINQVFPPTIDEVTRINCILHDNLEKAKEFGYVEVFKALATVIPYFYKAFIRHEANLRHFSERLGKFAKKNTKKILLNPEINKAPFSVQEIDAIVTGSLLELPRLKLIIRRLYDTISIEKLKLNNFDTGNDDEELKQIEVYYKKIVEVIDAYGFQSTEERLRLPSTTRVFTPTGKLLTELASDWPAELQYGWLSRKVVGIYELRNVKDELAENYTVDVLIIFSDQLLVLNIVDKDYYLNKKNSGPFHTPSLPDVLMHSLVNEKPLPALSLFPNMKVSYWCDIDDVIVSNYRGISSKTNTNEEFLRVINTSKLGFKTINLNHRFYTQHYQVTSSGVGSTSNKIVELVNKAKILHKIQPFHLFKLFDPTLNIYSTAHDVAAYKIETSKSPFVLFLNQPFSSFETVFEENEAVQVALNASFINDFKVQLTGQNRTGSYTVDEIIVADDLVKCLKEAIAKNFFLLFSSYNALTELLCVSYRDDLVYYSKYFAQSRAEQPEKVERKSMLLDNSEENPMQDTKIKPVMQKEKVTATPPVITTQKRRSLLKRLFGSIKRSKTSSISAPQPVRGDIPQKLQPAVELTSAKVTESKAKTISNTPIPKGEKKKFSHIYLPAPDLKKSDTINSEMSLRVASSGTSQCMASAGLEPSKRSRISSLDLKFRFPLPSAEGELATVPEETSPRTAQHSPGVPSISSSVIISPSKLPRRKPPPPMESAPALPSLPPAQEKVPSLKPVQAKSKLSLPVAPTPVVRSMVSDVQPAQGASKALGHSFSLLRLHTPSSSVYDQSTRIPSTLSNKHSGADNALNLDSKPLKHRSFSQRIRESQDFGHDFYNDGESNWVTISRENSSLLEQEVRALKEATHMDTLDVISVKERTVSNSLSQKEVSGDSFNPQAVVYDFDSQGSNYHTPLTQPTPSFDVHTILPPSSGRFGGAREDSLQSVSSAQFIDNFHKQIDSRFFESDRLDSSMSLDLYIDHATLCFDALESPEYVELPSVNDVILVKTKATVNDAILIKTKVTVVDVSTDEEFFSTEEMAQVVQVELPHAYSSSSDATIINEVHEPSKLMSPLATGTPHIDEPLAFRYDSMAYLSDVIDGSLAIADS